MTGVAGEQPAGEYRFISASLYDVQLERQEVSAGSRPKPSLAAALGGFAIDEDAHNFSAVMRLTVESSLPEDDSYLVRLNIGVVGHWVSAEPLKGPIDGAEAVDRLFPYAKAYAEQILGQAQISLPPIPDMADVPFSDTETSPDEAPDAADVEMLAGRETA